MFVIFLDLRFSLKNDTITTSWGETLVPESTFEHKIGDAQFATSCVQMLVTVSEPALMQWKLL